MLITDGVAFEQLERVVGVVAGRDDPQVNHGASLAPRPWSTEHAIN